MPGPRYPGSAIAAAAVLTVLAGCARLEPSRFAAASPGASERTVFVVGHGYHTGLIVRAGDIPPVAWPARRDLAAADYLELGWGDREYYVREDAGVGLALRALFVPTSSVVLVTAVPRPTHADREREFIELRLSQAGLQRLVEFVRQSHELDAQGRGIIVAAPSDAPGFFYVSPRTFHALENCNVWVARTLEAAGLSLQPGTAITAGMLLRKVRRLSDEQHRPAR